MIGTLDVSYIITCWGFRIRDLWNEDWDWAFFLNLMDLLQGFLTRGIVVSWGVDGVIVFQTNTNKEKGT